MRRGIDTDLYTHGTAFLLAGRHVPLHQVYAMVCTCSPFQRRLETCSDGVRCQVCKLPVERRPLRRHQ